MSSSTVAHLAATTDDIVSQICCIGLRATKTGVINCVSIWTAELVPGQIDRFLSRRGQLTNTLAINELNNATQDNEACTVQGGIK